MQTLTNSPTDGFIISDVELMEETPNLLTQSSNYTTNTRSRGLHRMGFKLNVYLATDHDVKAFRAFWLNVRGRLNPFVLDLMPIGFSLDEKPWYNPLYTDVRNATVASPIAVGGTSMTLAGVSSTIPAGSVFTFPNDSKIHTLLSDAKANQSVEFFPAARNVVAESAVLNFNPKPVLRLEEDKTEITLAKGTSVKLSAWENI
ncbi:hypothetical protein [Aeromonas popoffii]|uniref:hypothetical protein n=1 Tax=Aeromonas popoffii TaxID=70856 RepID=UPI0030CEFE57